MNIGLLEERIRKWCIENRENGCFAVFLQWNQHCIDINGDRSFPSASLIKLPILLEGVYQIENGTLDGKEKVSVSDLETIGGSGIIQYLSPTNVLTVKDLMELMIIVSDNSATNGLIDYLGIKHINKRCVSFGLHETQLNRRLMDDEARKNNIDNYTSARDIVACLKQINEYSAKWCKEMLFHQQFQEKLPFYLLEKDGVRVGNKTGEIERAEHDAAIIEYGKETFYIAVLTEQLKDNAIGKRFIQQIGKYIAESMREY